MKALAVLAAMALCPILAEAMDCGYWNATTEDIRLAWIAGYTDALEDANRLDPKNFQGAHFYPEHAAMGLLVEATELYCRLVPDATAKYPLLTFALTGSFAPVMEQIADTADIDRHGPETMRKILALVDRAKKWEQAKVEGRK